MKRAPGLNCPVYGGVRRTVLRVVDSDADAITIIFGPFSEKQRLAIDRVEAAVSKPPAEVMKTNRDQ